MNTLFGAFSAADLLPFSLSTESAFFVYYIYPLLYIYILLSLLRAVFFPGSTLRDSRYCYTVCAPDSLPFFGECYNGMLAAIQYSRAVAGGCLMARCCPFPKILGVSLISFSGIIYRVYILQL